MGVSDPVLTVIVGTAWCAMLGACLGYAIKDAQTCRPCHCPPCDDHPR